MELTPKYLVNKAIGNKNELRKHCQENLGIYCINLKSKASIKEYYENLKN